MRKWATECLETFGADPDLMEKCDPVEHLQEEYRVRCLTLLQLVDLLPDCANVEYTTLRAAIRRDFSFWTRSPEINALEKKWKEEMLERLG